MKVIIAGSRDITDYSLVKEAIKEANLEITEVVSGCARGVDSLGEYWAQENNIPVKRFPADWEGLGRAAGVIRNGQMAEYGEALIAIKYPNSIGTNDMIRKAKRNNLVVFIKRVEL